eukprot:3927112-Prymnesium_polylepis.1
MAAPAQCVSRTRVGAIASATPGPTHRCRASTTANPSPPTRSRSRTQPTAHPLHTTLLAVRRTIAHLRARYAEIDERPATQRQLGETEDEMRPANPESASASHSFVPPSSGDDQSATRPRSVGNANPRRLLLLLRRALPPWRQNPHGG